MSAVGPSTHTPPPCGSTHSPRFSLMGSRRPSTKEEAPLSPRSLHWLHFWVQSLHPSYWPLEFCHLSVNGDPPHHQSS